MLAAVGLGGLAWSLMGPAFRLLGVWIGLAVLLLLLLRERQARARHMNELRVKRRRAERRIAEQTASVTARVNNLAKAISVAEALVTSYQGKTRYLTRSQAETMAEHWREKLDLDLRASHLLYIAETTRAIEGLCAGRIAGNIEDIVIRVLCCLAVGRGHQARILEIGTLFGIASLVCHECLAPYTDDLKVVLIDPLSGFYDRGPDPPSGVPVNRKVLEHNIRRISGDLEDWKIIQAPSEDPQAVERAGRHTYDLLLIDGDHSYEGVRNDFEKYAPLVAAGGLILIDDYRAEPWPDVTRYVEELCARPGEHGIHPVDLESNTAVLRRVETRRIG